MVLLLIWLLTLQYKQCECSGITSEGTFSYFRAHHTIIGFRNLLGKEKRRQITAALKKAVYFLHLKPINVYSLETWSTLALLTRILFIPLFIQPQRWQDTLLTAEVIKWQKCARMGLNGFHIKCIIGTHCNWRNQNPGSPLGATS